MNNNRQIAKQKFDEHFMFKDNPIAWTAWKMAFQLGIEHQQALRQTDVSGALELLEQKLKEVTEESVPSDDSTGLEEKEIQIGYIKGVMEFISDLSANDR